MITMTSGEGENSPIINIFELITNDLKASNLEAYLKAYRQTELKIFGNNTVPYLINSDCAKNIMVAVLSAYNNETPKKYIERIINSLRNNEQLDPEKTTLAWCFGHSIRAVIRYSKSNINSQSIKKTELINVIVKLWNSVRVSENLAEIQKRILFWNWLLSQEKMKLGSIWMKLDPEFKFYNNLDEICDANEANDFINDIDNDELDNTDILENEMEIENLIDSNFDCCLDNNYLKFDFKVMEDCFKIFIPLINYEITTKKTDSFNEDGYVYNPLYNPQLKKYLENTWWKTVVFWSNLVPAIKDRTRRTTATVEVENNIIKSYDIKKRNLEIDEYLYQRVASINNNQSLVAEKIRY
jgi:hypothetical protein